MIKREEKWVTVESDQDESFRVFDTQEQAEASKKNDEVEVIRVEKRTLSSFFCDCCGDGILWGNDDIYTETDAEDAVLDEIRDYGGENSGDTIICMDCRDNQKDVELIGKLLVENKDLKAQVDELQQFVKPPTGDMML